MVLASAPTEKEVEVRFPKPRPIPEAPLVDWDNEEARDGYEHLKEIAKEGLLGDLVDILPWQRCLCGHLKGAHRGECEAHRCDCEGFRQDLRYELSTGGT